MSIPISPVWQSSRLNISSSLIGLSTVDLTLIAAGTYFTSYLLKETASTMSARPLRAMVLFFNPVHYLSIYILLPLLATWAQWFLKYTLPSASHFFSYFSGHFSKLLQVPHVHLPLQCLSVPHKALLARFLRPLTPLSLSHTTQVGGLLVLHKLMTHQSKSSVQKAFLSSEPYM